MVGLTGEIARVAHCSVVLALGASKLESEPDAGGEAGGAHVPHRAHLAGAREEDLGPLVQPQAPLGAARAGGAAPAATQGRLRPVRRGESEKLLSAKAARHRVAHSCPLPGPRFSHKRESFMAVT